METAKPQVRAPEPKIRPRNPDTDSVSVRLTVGEIMRIDEEAGRAGIDRSAWLRRTIRAALLAEALS